MINHHPTDEMLKAYVSGWLNASMSIAISVHEEMCPHCREKIKTLTAQRAQEVFEQTSEIAQDDEFESMISAIVADDHSDVSIAVLAQQTSFTFKDKEYDMPRALRNLDTTSWQHVGRIARSRVQLDDDAYRTSLLHIDEGGEVPEHSHNGIEVTLLLDGHFSDHMGEYNPGDFIVLDGKHQHKPKTKDGCLCLTVVNDSLDFKQGLSKLLNPIGKLIY